MPDTLSYVPHTPDVGQIQPDEAETFRQLDALFARLGDLMLDRYRHAIRSVHAKSHGLLVGDLTVLPNLPPAFAQGLFATPRTYAAAMRFSTNPGDILADSISTPRGLALKILDVPGERVAGSDPAETSQDFVMAVGTTFAAKDAKAFLGLQKVIELNANDPEPSKKAVSFGARAANAVLGVVGLESPSLAALGWSAPPLDASRSPQRPGGR